MELAKSNPEKLVATELFEHYFGDLSQNGSADILKMCAVKMIENLDTRIANLENAIQERDLSRIVNQSHQLKGSFSTMSCPYLASICEIIERDSSTRNFDFLAEKARSVKELSPQFKQELNLFLNQL